MDKLQTPMLNAEMLHELAAELMFKLSDKQCQNLLLELKAIDHQMESVIKIKTDNIKPLNHPFNFTIDLLRADVRAEPLTTKSVLALAPQTEHDYIVIKQVINYEH